jgi:hypothetical protein
MDMMDYLTLPQLAELVQRNLPLIWQSMFWDSS